MSTKGMSGANSENYYYKSIWQDNVLQAFFLIDESGTLLRFNHKAEELVQQFFGKKLKEGVPISQFILIGKNSGLDDEIKKAKIRGSFEGEITGRGKQWFRYSIIPVDGTSNFSIGLIDVTEFKNARDVTKHKEIEELLDQANRLARIGSWEVDLIEDTVYFSKITKEIHEVPTDYEPDLETGINFYQEGEHRDKVRQAIKEGVENGTPWDLEVKLITGKGNECWVRSIGNVDVADGKTVRIYGSFQDIHLRKVAELELEEKNSHINAIASLNAALLDYTEWFEALENHLEIIGEAVQSDRVYYFENRYNRETGEGFTTQKLEWCREGIKSQLNNPDLDEIPFREVPELVAPMIKGRPSMSSLSEIEKGTVTRYVMKDQDIKTFLAIPVNVHGEFYGFVGFDNCTEEEKWSEEEIRTLKTITSNLAIAIERDQTENEGKELLEEKDKILESISDAFYAIDENWIITYFNAEAENLLGRKSEKVIGNNIWELFAPAKQTELYERYHAVMEQKEPDSFEYFYPPLESWYDIAAYPAGDGISVYFKNIDERKEAEEKILVKTRQLDAIAKFNSQLIQREHWIEALEESLGSFGVVADADRAYFFENETEEGRFINTSMRLEWVREGVKSELENPVHQNQELDEIMEYYVNLSNNRPYNMIVSEMQNSEFKDMLNSQNIKSLLLVPVFVGQKFSGFLGFDDCREEVRWEEEVVTFLQTISINLGSAIVNEDAEEALQKAFDEKNIILESIGDAFFAVEKDWTVTYWNNVAESVLGMTRDEIVGENLWNLYADAVELEFYTQYHKAIREQETVHFEEYYPAKNIWFEVSAYPSRTGLSVFFKDITERKKMEERLLKSESRLQGIIDSQTNYIFRTDLQGNYTYYNPKFKEDYGRLHDEENLEGLHCMSSVKEYHHDRVTQVVDQCMKNPNKVYQVEIDKQGKQEGTKTTLWDFVCLTDSAGNLTEMQCVGIDITDKKAYEDKLKESLKEKEILLAEIHHRVKNNLAVVSGLMQIQASDEKNKEVEDILLDSVFRIRTMASIHELLYQSDSFSQVNFSNMLKKLLEDIASAMSGDKIISLEVNALPLELNINQAIPCALMINEVLTNAFKHAFKKREKGKITIDINENNGNVEVKVRDDGVGMSDEAMQNNDSLGVRLIEILTQQVGGEYKYAGDENGTHFILKFIKGDIKGSADALGLQID